MDEVERWWIDMDAIRNCSIVRSPYTVYATMVMVHNSFGIALFYLAAREALDNMQLVSTIIRN